MNRQQAVRRWICVVLVSAYATAANAGETRWVIDLEQSRLSAVINGDLLDDERKLTSSDTDTVRSWARSTLRLSQMPATTPQSSGLWAAYVVQESHARGIGIQAAARLNRPDGAVGMEYPFRLSLVQHRRWGVSWLHQAAKPLVVPLLGAVHWHAGFSAFAVDQFKSLDATGVLQDVAGGRLALRANSQEDELGAQSRFVQPRRVLGGGATLNAGLSATTAEGLHWSLAVRDLGPKVRLRHVLGEDKAIDTDTVSYDDDGYVNFAPAIQGRFVDRSATLRLEPEWRWQLTQTLNPGHQLHASWLVHGVREELSIGYQRQWGGQQLTLSAYALRDMPFSVGLRWDMPYGSLGWRGDNLSAGKARIWMLEGRLRF